MRLLQRTATAALVAAGFALAVPATISAQAAPAAASATSARAISTDSEIVPVRDGRRNHRHHRGHNDGWGNSGAYLGLGIAGAIIGGAISEGYDDGPDYSEGAGYSGDAGYSGGPSGAMQRCASQFRSFEWDTGLYTTFEGEKRLCPYLG